MSAPRQPSFLHVLNGDATAEPLRRAGVGGTLAVWAEPLHEGSVPADVDAPAWREERARFLAADGYVSREEALATLTAWDAAIADFGSHDEVVIWLEHDLFDQLLLIRHLEWFARRALGATRLSLICIDRFPGVEPFHGLGQLGPEQLASLMPSRREISAAQMELGRRAWAAFTNSDPGALQHLLDEGTPALPFLASALRRLLEEYPAVGTGLPRTERHVLEALGAGPRSKAQLFRDVQRMEERVFMGDTTFFARLQGMARGERPLIEIDGDVVSITDAGRQVLTGTLDWIEVAGIDKWIGGVHLAGRRVPWRWDGRASRLVPA